MNTFSPLTTPGTVLIGGRGGGGKTTAINHWLSDVESAVIAKLSGRHPDAAVAGLVAAVETLEQRRTAETTAPLIVVLDDAARIADNELAVAAIEKLTRFGRKAGVTLVLAGDHLNAFPSSVLGNAQTRIVFEYPDNIVLTDSLRSVTVSGRGDYAAQLPNGQVITGHISPPTTALVTA